jgi:MraZ protein
MPDWIEKANKIKKMPETKKTVRQYKLHVLGAATESELDKQGRVNIPVALRDYGKLTKSCTVVGVGDHIEIWDTEKYNESMAVINDNIEDIAEELVEFDFE